MNAFLKAGIGYYFTKVIFSFEEEYVSFFGLDMKDRDDVNAKDYGIGFHGGFGIEHQLGENISIYAEGIGRYAKFGGWEVNAKTSRSGATVSTASGAEFYYSEEFSDATGRYYPSLRIAKSAPSGPGYRNVRKAEIDLSGFSFRMGIRIKLGK